MFKQKGNNMRNLYRKYKILLTEKEVNMILSAIDNVSEYSNEWDNLYECIAEQIEPKEEA
jgi:predicted DNA-binding protein YlxM (UPF0122 family)